MDKLEFPENFPFKQGQLYNFAYNPQWPNVESQELWDFFIVLFSDALEANEGGVVKSDEIQLLLNSKRVGAKFWDKWARALKAKSVSYDDIHKMVFANMRSIKALALAEIAAAHVIDIYLGPGKTGLFELAIHPANLAPKNKFWRFWARIWKDDVSR